MRAAAESLSGADDPLIPPRRAGRWPRSGSVLRSHPPRGPFIAGSAGRLAGRCAERATLRPEHAPAFSTTAFDWVRIWDGKAFATGYYEPEIRGSRVRAPGADVPIYRTPADLTPANGPSGSGRGRITMKAIASFITPAGDIEDGALQAVASSSPGLRPDRIVLPRSRARPVRAPT